MLPFLATLFISVSGLAGQTGDGLLYDLVGKAIGDSVLPFRGSVEDAVSDDPEYLVEEALLALESGDDRAFSDWMELGWRQADKKTRSDWSPRLLRRLLGSPMAGSILPWIDEDACLKTHRGTLLLAAFWHAAGRDDLLGRMEVLGCDIGEPCLAAALGALRIDSLRRRGNVRKAFSLAANLALAGLTCTPVPGN